MPFGFPWTNRHLPLSEGTQARLAILFPRERTRLEAARMLVEECGSNLPMLKNLDSVGLERFRYAAMKVSDGSLIRLREAVDLAKLDWRDLLMQAGFANDVHEHESWMPEPRYS